MQGEAFTNIKTELTRSTVLALYAETMISADASLQSLGAVLLQLNGSLWQPVAYASRAFIDTEKRYTQIKKKHSLSLGAVKDFLATSSASTCKSQDISSTATVSCKLLENLAPGIIRFCLCMMRFDYSIRHMPCKLL